MRYISAIIVAAGKGKRFTGPLAKPLAKINALPVIYYSLKTLSGHSQIKEIVLVVNAGIKDGVARIIKKYRIPKVSGLVIGGRRRQDSVYNGLRAVNERADLVLIHDGARPFVGEELITAAIKEAIRYGAAIAGVPVTSTIKKVARSPSRQVTSNCLVEKTLDRSGLWEIQTPQVFRKDLIFRAYERFGNTDVTDDAALVEKSGSRVKVVMGAYSNIKITTSEDLAQASQIARCRAK
ncbi:MAG: 2-C-methyl-D-erythritol 4-phosphate cytidylyltransferase [Candidatus Omnitrophica bacterium]|nr:2-C-methyl-D-erythritol 4-phosphate cytidylyltransferase [Candidatus Omnitrophota bacterium]